MSQPDSAKILPAHYQAICGLALAAMFLVEIRQAQNMPHRGHLLLGLNAAMLVAGTLGIVARLRIAPLIVLAALGVTELFEQVEQVEFFRTELRMPRFNVRILLLAVATLTYMIGQFRLQGLWSGVLPADTRGPVQARSPASLSPRELSTMILPILLCAMFADLATTYLRQPWSIASLQPQWSQFLLATWLILLAVFFAAHAFRYWRRVQMDRTAAQLLLQDALWQETRGEQRRINRWIVWKRLRSRDR